MQVSIYRSSVTEGLYVYVAPETNVDSLPDPVKRQLGTPELAMEFELDSERKLPNADTAEVLEKLASQGFYIQMPKSIEAILADLSARAVLGNKK
jgi:uncharacterized protein YcgL (UPF0745 family)